MTLSPDLIRKLETELARIAGVSFAKIVVDERDRARSIDIVSGRDRSAKSIVRDAEIIFRQHNIDIDHKKIGVAQLSDPAAVRGAAESAPVPAAAAAAAAEPAIPDGVEPAVLELVPDSERVCLVAVHSTTRDGALSVEVELSLGAYEGVPGRAEGPGNDDDSSVSLVAAATLEAVRNLLQPGYDVLVRAARVVELGGTPLVTVLVDFGQGRDVQRLVGACPQRGSLYDTAVYATLDAINRPLGRAHFRQIVYLEGVGTSEDAAKGAASA